MITEDVYLVAGNVIPKMIAKIIQMNEIVLTTEQCLANQGNLFAEKLAYQIHGVAMGIKIVQIMKMRTTVRPARAKNGSFK